jgi:phenylalanine-4-hydroxylase
MAREPDASGTIHYTREEHAVWRDLMRTQLPLLSGRACDLYLRGLDMLDLPENRIPQCREISARLTAASGWRVKPVAALIPFDQFFQLLNNRVFPAASFIRSRQEFRYLQEPDIFHEIFGHTPLLTHPVIAKFSQHIGRIGVAAPAGYHVWLARLYWMTIEFGLLSTPEGLRALGAGIMSSNEELIYALESDLPERRPFDVVPALRTPYRIDQLQPIYYVLETLDQLLALTEIDLLTQIDEAKRLGLFPLIGTSAAHQAA